VPGAGLEIMDLWQEVNMTAPQPNERRLLMLIDRYAKIVFTIIAIALSMIALNPWIAQTPRIANAQSASPILFQQSQLNQIGILVTQIDKNVTDIVSGKCSNPKIC
jgi:hypothetical protein